VAGKQVIMTAFNWFNWSIWREWKSIDAHTRGRIKDQEWNERAL